MYEAMGSQPPHETKENCNLTLTDGTEVLVRAIQPDDVAALQRFHNRLSEQSLQLRCFDSMEELTYEKAKYFAHTDSVNHVAFVALNPDEPEEIPAVVRYDREAGATGPSMRP